MRPLILLLALLLPAVATPCTPGGAYDDTPRRVRSDFDSARFVVIADVIDVKTMMVRASPEWDFKQEVERATFRVVRGFKGGMRPGATFYVDSGRSSCGRGVLHDDWVVFVPGRKFIPASARPKRWLIYYTRTSEKGAATPYPPFEITASTLSRPAAWAAYDIELLERTMHK